jgi:hypothetical protein
MIEALESKYEIYQQPSCGMLLAGRLKGEFKNKLR